MARPRTGFVLWYKQLEKEKFKWPGKLVQTNPFLKLNFITCHTNLYKDQIDILLLYPALNSLAIVVIRKDFDDVEKLLPSNLKEKGK